MALSADDFVHENNGSSASGTSVAVSLAGADSTTAGNTVLVFMTSPAASITVPSGFVTDKTTSARFWVFRKSEVAASETSWTFTLATSTHAVWYVVEMSNLDPVDPLDVTGTGTAGASVSNGGTYSSGTTPLDAGLSVVAFAGIIVSPGTATAATWSGYTNGFEEIIDTDVAGGSRFSLTVARLFQDGTTGTFGTTATLAVTGGTPTVWGYTVVYRAADSPIAAPLEFMAGFEWGTHGGMGIAGGGTPTTLMGSMLAPTGTWNTHYSIGSGSARNGTYGLRVTTSAAQAYVYCGNFSVRTLSFGFNARVVSATGTVVVAQVSTVSTFLYLLYNASTNKYGLRWGTGGTVSYQSGTTALNTWVWIDVRLRSNTGTWHADWRIETGTNTYTDQTSPSDLSTSAQNLLSLVIGGTEDASATQTATIDFDDVIISRYYGAYPLGPHKISLLTVDTGGTPSVSGTTGNFSVFTSNGTLGAWNATNARNAIDEVPPTISASADGVVQTAVAASDYMEFPMATYTCASDEIVAAVRAYFAEWGGTGTGTGTIGYRGHDGTTETTFQAASASYDADSLTSTSATYPRWLVAMWPSTNGWTQAELNAAVLRVGFSTDATPDMGIHAAYLEVAIRKAITIRQITVDDPISATVDLLVHPYTSASVSYLITNNDATRSVDFNYSISGTPQTPVTVSPSSNQTLQLNATTFGEISDVGLKVV